MTDLIKTENHYRSRFVKNFTNPNKTAHTHFPCEFFFTETVHMLKSEQVKMARKTKRSNAPTEIQTIGLNATEFQNEINGT